MEKQTGNGLSCLAFWLKSWEKIFRMLKLAYLFWELREQDQGLHWPRITNILNYNFMAFTLPTQVNQENLWRNTWIVPDETSQSISSMSHTP